MTISLIAEQPGAVISYSDIEGVPNTSFLNAGSILGIALRIDNEAQHASIALSAGAKFTLTSVGMDACNFGPLNHAKLMLRCIRGDSKVSRDKWVCLCNFLGKAKGGKSLPNSTPFNLEAVGPCVIELAAHGAVKDGSLHVVGNLSAAFNSHVCQSTDSSVEAGVGEGMDEAQQGGRSVLSSREGMFKGPVHPFRFHVFFACFMILGLVGLGRGGFTKSAPTLHPTRQAPVPVHQIGNRMLIPVVFESQSSVSPSDSLATGEASSSVEDTGIFDVASGEPNSNSLTPTTLTSGTKTAKTQLPSSAPSVSATVSVTEMSLLLVTPIPIKQQPTLATASGVENAHFSSVPSSSPSTSAATSPPPGATLSQPKESLNENSPVTNTPTVSDLLPGSSSNCVNLTLGIVSFSVEGFPVHWLINITTAAGMETVWSNEYADSQLTNSIIFEHANGNNISSGSACLSPGTYTLDFDHSWANVYVIASEGELIKCSTTDVMQLGGFEFNLPFQANISLGNTTPTFNECPNVSCMDDEESCLEDALAPLQCFFRVAEFFGGNSSMLFQDEACAAVLSEACRSGSFGFDFGWVLDYFCPYLECAVPSYQAGGFSEEYFGCECLFTSFASLNLSPLNNQYQCCLDGHIDIAEENDLMLSCMCRIEPECFGGDNKFCDTALQYCCPAKNGTESNACQATILDSKCSNSIEQNYTDENGKYSVCHLASEAKCRDDTDESGCKCSYWESLCETYPQEAVCEDAVDSCCSFSSLSCNCDFYTFVSKNFDYTSNEEANACAQAINTFTFLTSEYDMLALKHIYKNLGGEWWINNLGWLDNETDHCEWFGIVCNQMGQVSQVNLKSNNLTGELFYNDTWGVGYLFGDLLNLEKMDLAMNKIHGIFESWQFIDLSKLVHVDISENQLTGTVDILLSPSILYLNLSHNAFSYIAYKNAVKSNRAYESIEIVDLSHNNINQNAFAVFGDLPPNLRELVLSDNSISGTLPNPFPVVENMEQFVANNNALSGPLIDFSRGMGRVSKINLSNQMYEGVGGLSGSIPSDMASLLKLVDLDLSGNQLTGSIPVDIANIPLLEFLNLSNNHLTGELPSEFGRLSAVSKVFDVSSNRLSRTIPVAFKDFKEGQVSFSGNAFTGIAPLGLCHDHQHGFDLRSDTQFCPPDRNALYSIFLSAKGQEWTNSSGWGDQVGDHCSWFGILCDNETKKIVALNLTNNGMSGILNESIRNIISLRVLDLNGNDIKGSIPKEIGDLADLTYLRLSYNAFAGNVPSLLHLKNLELAQFHSNWLTGTILLNGNLKAIESSFISDCGYPTDFERPIECPNCTMCCNIMGECLNTEPLPLFNEDMRGFRTFSEFLVVLLSLIFAGLMFMVLAIYYYNKHRRSHLTRSITLERLIEEKRHAWDAIGDRSVYNFFLTESWAAWIIALAVIIFQCIVYESFVNAAEKNFNDEKSEFVFSWRCPRNNLECRNTNDWTKKGWVIFTVLMICFLSKDLINGAKLVVMSTKKWHHRNRRIRFFFGGVCLVLITTIAVYASYVYNYAIATSDPELIVNAVIILFISDIDEMIHDTLEALCPNWLHGLHRNLVNEASAPKNDENDAEDFGNEVKTRDEPNNDEVSTFHARLLQMEDKMTFKFEQIDLELRHLRFRPGFHESGEF